MQDKSSLTVSQLNNYIGALMGFDEVLSNVTVKGEISNFKRHTSGHLYFSLKDEESKVSCVMFKSAASRLDFTPVDGTGVVVKGRVSVYEKNGVYQIYAESMTKDGIGSLYERYNRLLELLREKGYFDKSRKKPIPYLPKRIALVTSPAGAAVRDMISVISRRCPCTKILVCPVLVQGETAAYDIASMIKYINERQLADLIITGRGGGSIEDIWAFNEKIVADSVFQSQIPVISAVGHETDFTICDFVADMRAPTPSAAAELAVPDLEDLRFTIDRYRYALIESLERLLELQRQKLATYANLSMFRRPLNRLDELKLNVDELREDMERGMRARLDNTAVRLENLRSLLGSLSYQEILRRGYCVLVRDNQYIHADEIREEDSIKILTHKKIAAAKVIKTRKREVTHG